MLKTIVLCTLTVAATSCQTEHFSAERPYAIEVNRYRHYLPAVEKSDRLQQMGLPSYIKMLESEEKGRFYLLLMGSYTSLEACMADRIRLEDEYRFMELQIVNFIKFGEELQVPDENGPGFFSGNFSARPDGILPGLRQLSREMPFNNDFLPVSVKLLQKTPETDLLQVREIKKEFFDLPRGIALQDLLPGAGAFAEVVYRDEFVGSRYTVHMLKMCQPEAFGEEPSARFADKILGTREYSFEEKLPTRIEGLENWGGYLVNIEPRKGKVARYLVMHNPADSLLLFVQSMKAAESSIKEFASSCGKEQGLQSYSLVAAQLGMLPADTATGPPVFIKLKKLEEVKGPFASRLEKNWKAEFVFYHPEKGGWDIAFTSLPESDSPEQAFERIFSKSSKKDSATVAGRHAWMVTNRRRHPGSGEFCDAVAELQFYGNHFVGVMQTDSRCCILPEEATQLADLFGKAPKEKDNGLLFWQAALSAPLVTFF